MSYRANLPVNSYRVEARWKAERRWRGATTWRFATEQEAESFASNFRFRCEGAGLACSTRVVPCEYRPTARWIGGTKGVEEIAS